MAVYHPRYFVIVGLFLALSASSALGVVTSATRHSVAFDGFDGLLSSTDLIQGLNQSPDVFENPGDLGWHPANTNPANQLPAFTDGLGGTETLTGLLNENFLVNGNMPLSGAPVKVVEYVFDTPQNLGRINILAGNRNNSDGRIFMTTSIMYSTDGGNNFDLLGYFQSDPSGVVNNEGNPQAPFDPAQAATFVSIFDDQTTSLLSGVTNIEFSFYAVDADDLGLHGDPFTGVNDFTGVDDEINAAFKSPLIWEIDVLAPAANQPGDYNGDGSVDAADYIVWRNSFGTNVAPGSGADGSGNGVIDTDDHTLWALYYGAESGPGSPVDLAAVPEPTAIGTALVSICLVAWGRRRWAPAA